MSPLFILYKNRFELEIWRLKRKERVVYHGTTSYPADYRELKKSLKVTFIAHTNVTDSIPCKHVETGWCSAARCIFDFTEKRLRIKLKLRRMTRIALWYASSVKSLWFISSWVMRTQVAPFSRGNKLRSKLSLQAQTIVDASCLSNAYQGFRTRDTSTTTPSLLFVTCHLIGNGHRSTSFDHTISFFHRAVVVSVKYLTQATLRWNNFKTLEAFMTYHKVRRRILERAFVSIKSFQGYHVWKVTEGGGSKIRSVPSSVSKLSRSRMWCWDASNRRIPRISLQNSEMAV